MLNSVLGALQVALACQNLKKTFKVDEKSLAYKNPKTKKVIPSKSPVDSPLCRIWVKPRPCTA